MSICVTLLFLPNRYLSINSGNDVRSRQALSIDRTLGRARQWESA